jgi:hypothetical protein
MSMPNNIKAVAATASNLRNNRGNLKRGMYPTSPSSHLPMPNQRTGTNTIDE